MKIILDRASCVPLREQIVHYFEIQIRSGVFNGGMKLPSIRSLAHEIGVNPSTVREAYDSLEARNLTLSQAGRGTFVCPDVAPVEQARVPFDAGESDPHRPIIYATMVASNCGDVLSLDQQVPNPSALPLEDFDLASRYVWRRNSQGIHAYGDPQGRFELRKQIAQLIAWRGVIGVRANDILVTSGVVEALYLCLATLCRPNDAVIVESPTWGVALSMLDQFRLRTLPVEMTPEGMDLRVTERLLATNRVRAILTVPCGHNPTGISSSLAHREALVSLAAAAKVPIIEDDIYGLLGLGQPEAPSLAAIDKNRTTVFSLSGFSKSLGPALRTGWIVAPPQHFKALLAAKQNLNLHPSQLIQHILDRYLALGHFNRYLNRARCTYEALRDEKLAIISEKLGPSVTVNAPMNGFALWLKLPAEVSARAVVARMLQQGVYATPGTCFYAANQISDGDRHLRLSFTRLRLSEFARGIDVLKNALAPAVPAIRDVVAT